MYTLKNYVELLNLCLRANGLWPNTEIDPHQMLDLYQIYDSSKNIWENIQKALNYILSDGQVSKREKDEAHNLLIMYGKEKGMVREETRVNIEKLFNDVQNTPRGGNLQRSSWSLSSFEPFEAVINESGSLELKNTQEAFNKWGEWIEYGIKRFIQISEWVKRNYNSLQNESDEEVNKILINLLPRAENIKNKWLNIRKSILPNFRDNIMRFDSVKEILEVDNNVTGRLVADLYSDLQPLFNPQAYDEVSKEKVKPTPYKLFGIDNTLTLIEKSLLSTFYTLHKNLG